MCVICHKPVGVALPSDEDIDKMFDQNPHGAGFAIQTADKNGKCKVEYWKGYMNVESFKKALHSHGDLTNARVVMHFRIKTSGETDQYTTHPFKMSHNFQDLRKLHGYGSVLFHNGVFSGLGGLTNEKASDTQDFVIGVAMHYLRQAKPPKKVNLAIAKQVIGSCRVIILYPNIKFSYQQFGSWEKHTDGCEYSNMLWNRPKYSYNYGYSSAPAARQTTLQTRTATDWEEIDEWGCNIAQYAWPSPEHHWMNAGTISRFDLVMKQAKVLSENTELDYKVVQFARTGELKWYAFAETLDLVAEDMLETYNNYQAYVQFYY